MQVGEIFSLGGHYGGGCHDSCHDCGYRNYGHRSYYYKDHYRRNRNNGISLLGISIGGSSDDY